MLRVGRQVALPKAKAPAGCDVDHGIYRPKPGKCALWYNNRYLPVLSCQLPDATTKRHRPLHLRVGSVLRGPGVMDFAFETPQRWLNQCVPGARVFRRASDASRGNRNDLGVAGL